MNQFYHALLMMIAFSVPSNGANNPTCVIRQGPRGTPGPVQISYLNYSITVDDLKNPTNSFKAKATATTHSPQEVRQDEILTYIVTKAGVRLSTVNQVWIYLADLDDDGGSIGIVDIKLTNPPSAPIVRRGLSTTMAGIDVLKCSN